MKKTLPLFILSLGTLFAIPSFGKTNGNDTTTNSPSPIQVKLCTEYTSSLESAETCINDTSFSPERFSTCILYSNDLVSETICLKNKGLTVKKIVDCSLMTETILEEQVCLLNNPEIKSIESAKTNIEQLIEFKVEFNTLEILFMFPQVPKQNMNPDENQNQDGDNVSPQTQQRKPDTIV